jgi:hypothetical protein
MAYEGCGYLSLLCCLVFAIFVLVHLLLSDGAVPMEPAAFKEAVTHHALAKQKKDDCQDDYKEELSSSERGWLSSCRVRRF